MDVSWGKRGNKYNAKKAKGADGYTYDSKFEASVSNQIEWRKKAGEIKDWERQYGVDLFEPCPHCGEWIHKARWKVDFRIHHLDGSFELVEAKGFETKDFKEKEKMLKKMLEKEHPSLKNTKYTRINYRR